MKNSKSKIKIGLACFICAAAFSGVVVAGATQDAAERENYCRTA